MHVRNSPSARLQSLQALMEEPDNPCLYNCSQWQMSCLNCLWEDQMLATCMWIMQLLCIWNYWHLKGVDSCIAFGAQVLSCDVHMIWQNFGTKSSRELNLAATYVHAGAQSKAHSCNLLESLKQSSRIVQFNITSFNILELSQGYHVLSPVPMPLASAFRKTLCCSHRNSYLTRSIEILSPMIFLLFMQCYTRFLSSYVVLPH